MNVTLSVGVTNIIANLTPERLAAVVEEGYMGREVIVEIPKFTVEKSLPLRDVSLTFYLSWLSRFVDLVQQLECSTFICSVVTIR